MTKTYLQVRKQIEQLQKEADLLRKQEADGVLRRIKEAIAVYGFSAAELGFGAGTSSAAVASRKRGRTNGASKGSVATRAAAPKFKDDNGNVWSGRGPRPAWFKAALESGKSMEDLRAN